MSQHRIELIGRQSSHFTRVAAMFAHELEIPLERVVVYDLSSADVNAYGGNPALKIPTLRIDGFLLFGTENICRRLMELSSKRDLRIVLTEHLSSDLVRSAQELVWHAMAAQVQLIVLTHFGKIPRENPSQIKVATGLMGSLAWLDQHLDQILAQLPDARDLSLFEVSLFCLIEHLSFRVTVPAAPYPALAHFAARYATRPSAQATPYVMDKRPDP